MQEKREVNLNFPIFLKSENEQEYIYFVNDSNCVIVNTYLNMIREQKCFSIEIQLKLDSKYKISDAEEFTEAFDKVELNIEEIANDCRKIFDSVNMDTLEYNRKWVRNDD